LLGLKFLLKIGDVEAAVEQPAAELVHVNGPP
jgi:hypothetical protein